MGISREFSGVALRNHFHQVLGPAVIRDLHRENIALDLLVLALMPVLFLSLAYVLATQPIGAVWLVCLVLQGTLLMNLGLVHHDLLMHRHVLKGKTGELAGMLLLTPLYRSATQYRTWHSAHHRYLGTPADTEQFKVDIDSRWRRLLYATAVGALMSGLVSSPRPGSVTRILPDESGTIAGLRRDLMAIRAFTVLWVALAFIWPRWVLLGYVLPLLVIAPLANTLRTVLEHTDFDRLNPFQLSCCYRTGWLTRLMFFFDGGDCHLVHHVFPCIPFYRMPRAVRLMRDGFAAHGVRMHQSLLRLVIEWFRADRRYLTAASSPAGRMARHP